MVPEEPVEPALEPGLVLVPLLPVSVLDPAVPLEPDFMDPVESLWSVPDFMDPVEPLWSVPDFMDPVEPLWSVLEPVLGFAVVEPLVPVLLEPVSLEPVVVEPAEFEPVSDFVEPVVSDFMEPVSDFMEPVVSDFMESLLEPVVLPELMPMSFEWFFRAWCFFIFFLVVVLLVLLDESFDDGFAGVAALSLLVVLSPAVLLPAPVPVALLPAVPPALTPKAAAASPATSRYLSFLCIPVPLLRVGPPLHAAAA